MTRTWILSALWLVIAFALIGCATVWEQPPFWWIIFGVWMISTAALLNNDLE